MEWLGGGGGLLSSLRKVGYHYHVGREGTHEILQGQSLYLKVWLAIGYEDIVIRLIGR